MRTHKWQVLLAAALIAVSAVAFGLQLLIFDRPADTLFYLLQDIGFVPIQVLLVTLVINELLQRREREIVAHKMNIVIGSFFTQAGNTLLRYLSQFDVHIDQIRNIARIETRWTERDFARARGELETYDYTIDCHCAELSVLKKILNEHRWLLLELLANPNLLEHESFTELLWAILHISQELDIREDVDNLSNDDYAHMSEDLRRAYILLTFQWLLYVRHLRSDYPYMYSFVVRTNPFEENPPH